MVNVKTKGVTMLQTWTSAATIRCYMHPNIDAIPLDGDREIETKRFAAHNSTILNV